MADTAKQQMDIEAMIGFVTRVDRAARLCGIDLERAMRFIVLLGQESQQPPDAAPTPERTQ